MGRCSIVKPLPELFYLTLLSETTYLLSTLLPEGRYMVTFFLRAFLNSLNLQTLGRGRW